MTNAEVKKWIELSKLSKDEIFSILVAYDEYVFQISQEEFAGEPVGVLEFYDNDYQEYVKGVVS